MKCKNCGGMTFVKFASHSECDFCGQRVEDVPSIVTEQAVEQDPKEALYKALIGYTEQVRINGDVVRATSMEILKNDPDDGIAKCLLAYLDRNEYPENYKDSILALSLLELGEKTEKWICELLIGNSEYKYFDSIVDMLLNRRIYSDYSQLLIDAKNRLEAENENYSNLPREVFVCYSSNDLKTVEEIVERLEADGRSCWYADRNMPQNSLIKTEYKTRIEDAISKCKVFLVVMSPNSMLSEDVNWELDVADRYGIVGRIEYRIKNAENTTRFKRFFDGIQWIDAANETQYHTLLTRVYDAVSSAKVKVEADEIKDAPSESANGEAICDDADNENGSANEGNGAEETCNRVDAYDVDGARETEDASNTEEADEVDKSDGNEVCDTEECIEESEVKDVESEALALFEVNEYDKAFILLAESNAAPFGNLTNFYIGTCLEKGYGTDIDHEQAEYFYRLAENGEESGSEEQLGRCFYLLAMKYARGDFLEKDDKRAFELFRRAAEYKNGNAIFNLGIYYKIGKGTERDHEKAFACFDAAKEYIPEEANFQLGICYDEGYGVEKDPEKAVKCYKTAADLGNVKALTNLGMHYYYGNGIGQNYEKAFDYYRAAAAEGNDVAQCNLGLCYFTGAGVTADVDFARDWLERAAKNGNRVAARFIVENF